MQSLDEGWQAWEWANEFFIFPLVWFPREKKEFARKVG
jgi:hypothetical protein